MHSQNMRPFILILAINYEYNNRIQCSPFCIDVIPITTAIADTLITDKVATFLRVTLARYNSLVVIWTVYCMDSVRYIVYIYTSYIYT